MVVLRFPDHAQTSDSFDGDGSGGYRSGRNSWRGTPVSRSISSTRSAGTRSVSQRRTVVVFTQSRSASCLSVTGGTLVTRYVRSGLVFVMEGNVAHNATICQAGVAYRANDAQPGLWLKLRMSEAQRSSVIHYIPEWAAEAGLNQAKLAAATGADKSTVSRWFDGVIPTSEYMGALLQCLGAPDANALFIHPEEFKLIMSFRDRPEGVRRRMIQTLESAFPRDGSAA